MLVVSRGPTFHGDTGDTVLGSVRPFFEHSSLIPAVNSTYPPTILICVLVDA